MERYEGERLYLRILREEDVNDKYLAWFRDDRVTQFLEAKNLERQEVLDYIKAGQESRTYFMHAICLKENDKHIGNLKVGPIDRKHMTSDLVVVIGDKQCWGKGLASEAIAIGNRIAFEKYNIRKLSGGMYSDNIGSVKCYVKAGWVIEGRLVGHYTLDGKVLDRICVSCFNPKFFDLSDPAYHNKVSLDEIIGKAKG
jgi:[ribosomal protein S5]-alanine N-acetyltransferase